jgi:hypothetical protein
MYAEQLHFPQVNRKDRQKCSLSERHASQFCKDHGKGLGRNDYSLFEALRLGRIDQKSFTVHVRTAVVGTTRVQGA